MNQIVQQTAFDVRDAEVLDAVADAAPRSAGFDAVEYGSGWYHDAAIVAADPAPAQKH